jgi:hypothetical protein
MLVAVRRKFYELHAAGSLVIASQTRAPPWTVEAKVRSQSVATRTTARQHKSAAIVAARR